MISTPPPTSPASCTTSQMAQGRYSSERIEKGRDDNMKGLILTLIKIAYSSPDVEWPKIWSVLAVPSLQLIQKF
jgi:hypothetical protein